MDTKIFASIVDDVTKKQIEDLGMSDAYKDSVIRVMPDCHAGKGCTIGSVIQYTDRVVPNTVGVDIGCGMMVLELGDIDIDFKKLDEVINNCIPSGFSVHEKPVAGYNVDFIADISKKEYIQCSIGSLGGGNHFIEVDVDDDGCKYLVIHSGSRNLGVQVCNYWQDKAIANLTDDSKVRSELIARLKAEGRDKEIGNELKKLQKPQINKELAYLEGDNLDGYIHDMKLCQEYASHNRGTMAAIICKEMEWIPLSKFETIHNYIDIPNKIIRKGAVRAEKDDILIIPILDVMMTADKNTQGLLGMKERGFSTEGMLDNVIKVTAKQSQQLKYMALIALMVVQSSKFESMIAEMMMKFGRGEEALKAMFDAKLKGM